MTPDDAASAGERTAATMHSTAEQLEVAEAILHHSAERSPDAGTTERLHALADEVTAQARDIDRRAGRLSTAAAPDAGVDAGADGPGRPGPAAADRSPASA